MKTIACLKHLPLCLEKHYLDIRLQTKSSTCFISSGKLLILFNYYQCELNHPIFYPSQIPVNYTIFFKKAILSKVKNRFNQDYYSKTYNQNDFLLYFIFQKIWVLFDLVSAEE